MRSIRIAPGARRRRGTQKMESKPKSSTDWSRKISLHQEERGCDRVHPRRPVTGGGLNKGGETVNNQT